MKPMNADPTKKTSAIHASAAGAKAQHREDSELRRRAQPLSERLKVAVQMVAKRRAREPDDRR